MTGLAAAMLDVCNRRIAALDAAIAAEDALIARAVAERTIVDGDHHWQARHALRERVLVERAARAAIAEAGLG